MIANFEADDYFHRIMKHRALKCAICFRDLRLVSWSWLAFIQTSAWLRWARGIAIEYVKLWTDYQAKRKDPSLTGYSSKRSDAIESELKGEEVVICLTIERVKTGSQGKVCARADVILFGRLKHLILTKITPKSHLYRDT